MPCALHLSLNTQGPDDCNEELPLVGMVVVGITLVAAMGTASFVLVVFELFFLVSVVITATGVVIAAIGVVIAAVGVVIAAVGVVIAAFGVVIAAVGVVVVGVTFVAAIGTVPLVILSASDDELDSSEPSLEGCKL